MRRTQLYLTDEQARLLESRSRATGRSRSELIRAAIDTVYTRRRALSQSERCGSRAPQPAPGLRTRRPGRSTSSACVAQAPSRVGTDQVVRLVLDTSVLIDHLRGRPGATELIPTSIARGDELWSSEVVRAELFAGMRAGAEKPTRDLMRLISWAEVDETASEVAGALGRRYLRSHPGIEIADLIIAALVQHLDAGLKTANVKVLPDVRGAQAPVLRIVLPPARKGRE